MRAVIYSFILILALPSAPAHAKPSPDLEREGKILVALGDSLVKMDDVEVKRARKFITGKQAGAQYREVDAFFRQSRATYVTLQVQPERRKVVLTYIDSSLDFIDSLIALVENPSEDGKYRTDRAFQRFAEASEQLKKLSARQFKGVIADKRTDQAASAILTALGDCVEQTSLLSERVRHHSIPIEKVKKELMGQEHQRLLQMQRQIADLQKEATPNGMAMLKFLARQVQWQVEANANILRFAETKDKKYLAAYDRILSKSSAETEVFPQLEKNLLAGMRSGLSRATASTN